MSNFWILVKNNARVFWGSIKNRKNGKGKYAASGALMAFLFLFIGFTLASQSVAMAATLIEAGVPDLSIFMSLISALTIGILFGLMRAANTAGSKDAELLLALPVRRVTVVCSKVVTQYIFDAPLMIVIFASTVISRFVMGGGDMGGLIRGLILTLLLPMIPITLSYLLGAILTYLQQRFKMTSIITTGILMALLIGYMFINFQSSSILEGATKGGLNNANAMIGKIAPLSWLTHFVLDGSALPVILSLLMLIIPFCLAVWLFAAVFGKPKSAYQSQSRVLAFSTRTPRMALLDKEIRRYLSCSIYVFNTAFGPVILLILAIAVAVAGPDKIVSGIGFTDGLTLTKDLTYVILAGIFCLFPSMTSTTASSVSLEGKQLWILKVHPVRTKDIFWSKYMLNIILMVPALIVSVIIIGIRMQMPILEVLGFIALVSVLSVLISIVGLIINLQFPRFDWDNETSVVKQSMSVMLSMLAGFVLACIPFVLFFTLFQKYGFGGFCVLCIGVYGIFTAISYLFLQTKGKRLFEAL